MALTVLNIVLPIAIVLALGVVSRRRGWISASGVDALKNIVGKITLPVILFNAMFTASYSLSAVVTIAAVFLGFVLALLAGLLLSKAFPRYGKYFPYLITTCESGMLGYPLIALLFGAAGQSAFAMTDLPHTVFFFTVAATGLRIADGEKPDVKNVVRGIFSAAPFDGMLLGMILGLAGVDELLARTPVWTLYATAAEFITAPTTVLVLLFLGYSLSFRKELMRSVIATSLLRLAVTGAAGALAAFAVFRFVPFDRVQLFAILLVFLLPPSFSIPVFSRLEGSEEYVSTTISFSTIVSLLAFVVMAVFALA